MEDTVSLLVLSNFRDAVTGEAYNAGDVIEVRRSVYERMERNDGPVEPAAADAPSGDEAPTMESTKLQIKDWLDAHGVEYPAKATKAELLALVP